MWRGVLNTVLGFEYRGDYHEYCRDSLSTMADTEYREGYHDASGGYHEYRGGCSVPRGILIHVDGIEHPSRYSRYPPMVLMIPHSTEQPHGTQDISHVYHESPRYSRYSPRYS